MIIGVSIIAMVYKFVFADKKPTTSAHTAEPTKIKETKVKEPEKPKGIEFPCFEEKPVEPCDEKARRFSLDGTLCSWRHYIGVFGKHVLCRSNSEKKGTDL